MAHLFGCAAALSGRSSAKNLDFWPEILIFIKAAIRAWEMIAFLDTTL